MNKNFSFGLIVVIALGLTACDQCRVKTDNTNGEEITPQGKVIPGSPEDFSQNVQSKVYFGFNESALTPSAKKVAEAQANWLNTYPNTTATIAGHTDERGTEEYNMALGARRSESTKKAICEKGVDPSRITTVSFGKSRPDAVVNNVVSNSNPEVVHAKNRRTETTIN